MIDLKGNTLKREIPENLLKDDKVVNLADALQASLDRMLSWTDKINYAMHLEKLDDAILDHLLWEQHITWNEGLSLAETSQEKINLINAAIDLHRTKGTPYAVEKVLQAVSLKGEVLEWWRYNAEPYHFLIELELTKKVRHIEDVRRMVMEFKNVRSWFDGFVMLVGEEIIEHIDQTYDYPVYYPYSSDVHGTAEFTLFDDPVEHIDQTYDYEVAYWVNEVFVTTTNAGQHILSDAPTYDYPVDYGTCGVMETLPVILTKEHTLHSVNPTEYDYEVELYVHEAFVVIMPANSEQHDIPYDYMAEYSTCGELNTLTVKLSVFPSEQQVQSNNYTYPTRWLMCGDFECGEELI